jgi:hypothetical protein
MASRTQRIEEDNSVDADGRHEISDVPFFFAWRCQLRATTLDGNVDREPSSRFAR